MFPDNLPKQQPMFTFLPWAALVAVGGPSPELAEYLGALWVLFISPLLFYETHLWAAPPRLEDGEWSTGLEGGYFALPYTAAAEV